MYYIWLSINFKTRDLAFFHRYFLRKRENKSNIIGYSIMIGRLIGSISEDKKGFDDSGI